MGQRLTFFLWVLEQSWKSENLARLRFLLRKFSFSSCSLLFREQREFVCGEVAFVFYHQQDMEWINNPRKVHSSNNSTTLSFVIVWLINTRRFCMPWTVSITWSLTSIAVNRSSLVWPGKEMTFMELWSCITLPVICFHTLTYSQ